MVNHNVNHKTIELINSLKNKEKIRVLFVCLGNICRSPAAQAVMQQIVDEAGASADFYIDSAGLYSGHAGQLPDRRMRVHANRRGYTLDHRARPVHTSDFFDFDTIVAMDGSNYRQLCQMAPSPEDERKVVRMMDFCRVATRYDHVPDPYYEGAEGFELVLDLLQDACRGLFEEINNNG